MKLEVPVQERFSLQFSVEAVPVSTMGLHSNGAKEGFGLFGLARLGVPLTGLQFSP